MSYSLPYFLYSSPLKAIWVTFAVKSITPFRSSTCSAGGIGHSLKDLVWLTLLPLNLAVHKNNIYEYKSSLFCFCLISADTPGSTTLHLQGCRFDYLLFPVETCPGPVISWTEIHRRLPDRPAKRRGSTRNRYASALNPKRPRYICQACPEKPPPVQMLSPLRLHQKI